jgi:4-hydroxybenzoyl-CoA thioesterase
VLPHAYAEIQSSTHRASSIVPRDPAYAGTSGWERAIVTEFSKTRTVRIEWGDCDPAGIIFYPRYFEIFDASTAHLFEAALGVTKFQMFKNLEFAGFPLVRTHARFLKPTRFGDDVAVESKIVFGRSSFDVEHRLSLKGDVCAECSEKRVWVVRDADGRLRSHPVPESVLAKFYA